MGLHNQIKECLRALSSVTELHGSCIYKHPIQCTIFNLLPMEHTKCTGDKTTKNCHIQVFLCDKCSNFNFRLINTSIEDNILHSTSVYAKLKN